MKKKLLPGLSQHYDVSIVQSRRDALAHVLENDPDMLLIDLPSIRFDLARFCDDLQEKRSDLPIFLLLNKGVRLDQLPRANGYLRHPFTIRQLLRRLARVLPEHLGETVSWEGLRLDTDEHILMWSSNQVPLTPKQALLALIFLRSPEKVLSRAYLMQEVWGTDYLGDTRTLDVHIHWLRKAFKQLDTPLVIETLRGEGYRLILNSDVDIDAD